jgi:hypothetical protein
MNLGSNSAISDALIEKAVAAGKTEANISATLAAACLTQCPDFRNFWAGSPAFLYRRRDIRVLLAISMDFGLI